ncbi:EthD family reductase [Bacillus sp. SCS-153A]|uniref:EthD family reductase n=1 Tax=Rossellomorea sedimentorum TaxID=3115294 RepID=UPI003905A6E6
MPKVIVMYEHPKDKEGFDHYYFNQHTPLVDKVPHVGSASVQKVLNTQNTDLQLYIVTEIVFEDKAGMKAAFTSSEWQEVTNDVPNLLPFLEKPPIIAVVD